MERHVIGFLRAALLWLLFGTALGFTMAVHPAWIVYRPVHVHAMLLGFVTMFIAGVGYHVLPRFSGTGLASPRLADLHLLVANVGLVVLECGFIARVRAGHLAPTLLAIGGTLSLVGAWMLVWNLWRTLARAILPSRPTPRSRPVPVSSPPRGS
ncbi:MAG TPA: cbb3-type cytochrome c oxidase subunit I [Gemmatimonadales bacterium]|nr:cbb3-type cytochrome c oxidase subunit I [Gemmatimonadales bacterium]